MATAKRRERRFVKLELRKRGVIGFSNFSTEEKCELPFSLPIQDLSKGLNAMKEIFYNRTSPHYTDMLNVLKQIPWDVF